MKKFKAESKKILDLMINSIYSSKDIFIRELISNASDALDKRRIRSLQEQSYKYKELKIEILLDKKNRTISISDNGIGMDKDELDKNLGTIAHSGSSEFLKQIDTQKIDIKKTDDIIGKFGVGFYSSFIVADKVEVISKNNISNAYKWESKGEETYNIVENDKSDIGSDIILFLKEGEDFDIFLDKNYINEIIKRYSNYIKYPIYVYNKDEKDKKKIEPTNEQVAIWKKDKRNIKQEDYDNFYISEFGDIQPPLHTMLFKAEGLLSYVSLLFIPKSKSPDFYNQNYKKGLELYSKGVLIDSNNEDVISPTFRFIKGLIDSEDISLNISREMLQKDVRITKLCNSLDNKIKRELLKLLKDEREKYNIFYSEFGMHLLYTIYESFGQKKELLQDLIMFKTSKSDKKYVTLKEYISNMKKDQNKIYYFSGKNIDKMLESPHMEKYISEDIEVLFFENEISEFAIKIMNKYENKDFASITQETLENNNKEELDKLEKETEKNKELLNNMKKILGDKVIDVKLSSILKNSPIRITTEKDGITLEMEKVLKENSLNSQSVLSKKILEINPNHKLFNTLKTINKESQEKLELYTEIIFKQALMLEGINIENPMEYTNEIINLMTEKNN